MLNMGVNWLAVLLATIASMALGMVWYMGFAKAWISATGKSEQELMGEGKSPSPFVFAALAQFVMAFFLANLVPGVWGSLSAYNGAMTGLFVWGGFVITAMIINHRYQSMSWKLTLIDGGYLLGVLVVQGVVIGLFG